MRTDNLVALAELWLIPLTLSLVIVLALRKPFGKHFGASAAYGLWFLPPIVLLAALLPNHSPATQVLMISTTQVFQATQGMVSESVANASIRDAMALIWIAGVVLSVLMMTARELRFRRTIGPFIPCGKGLWRASSKLRSPALVGLLRPRIVVPQDFETRYTARQRQMILRHEEIHRRRGDHWANAAAASLQCLFWFHPLVWWAGRYFRTDQEIACDALVLRQFPEWPQSYAAALVPDEISMTTSTCRWSNFHSLKDRINMLKQARKQDLPRGAGPVLVSLLAMLLAGAAWSSGSKIEMISDMVFFEIESRIGSADGSSINEHHFVLGTTPGKPATINTEGPDGTIEYELRFKHHDEEIIELAVTIKRNDEVVGTPRIRFPIDSEDGALIRKGTENTTIYSLNILARSERPDFKH